MVGEAAQVTFPNGDVFIVPLGAVAELYHQDADTHDNPSEEVLLEWLRNEAAWEAVQQRAYFVENVFEHDDAFDDAAVELTTPHKSE